MKKTVYAFILAMVLGSIVWVVAVSFELPKWINGQVLTATDLNQNNLFIKEAINDANSEIEILRSQIAKLTEEVEWSNLLALEGWNSTQVQCRKTQEGWIEFKGRMEVNLSGVEGRLTHENSYFGFAKSLSSSKYSSY